MSININGKKIEIPNNAKAPLHYQIKTVLDFAEQVKDAEFAGKISPCTEYRLFDAATMVKHNLPLSIAHPEREHD